MGASPPVSLTESGAESRARLLDTAERLFAAHGFAATSVRDITGAAGCNVAAINYYFGGKDNLYREVFRRRLATMRVQRVTRMQAVAAGPVAPTLEEVVSAFATSFIEPLLDRSQWRSFMELMAREMLDPHLERQLFHDEIIAPVHEAAVAALTAAEPGLDPRAARLCVVSLVGQLMHVVHRVRLDGTGSDAAALPPLPELVEHIARFSAAGVRACAVAPAPASHPRGHA